jgi:hypothetical protein
MLIVFIVDRDRTVTAALRAAFPCCIIVYCIWHILSNIKTQALHVVDRNEWSQRMVFVFQEFFDTAAKESFDEEFAALTQKHVSEHPEYAPVFEYVRENVLPHRESFCKAWLNEGFLMIFVLVTCSFCMFYA